MRLPTLFLRRAFGAALPTEYTVWCSARWGAIALSAFDMVPAEVPHAAEYSDDTASELRYCI